MKLSLFLTIVLLVILGVPDVPRVAVEPGSSPEEGAVGVAQNDFPPPLPPENPEVMPLEEVKPGMKVVAYTVFQGNKIEPFVGTVQGIVYNHLGPQRHIIMVMFEGDRLNHMGIVHGMSGSPVYIDGRLVGALALAVGPFQKDPLGGVTPIVYMLEEAGETVVPRNVSAQSGAETEPVLPIPRAERVPTPRAERVPKPRTEQIPLPRAEQSGPPCTTFSGEPDGIRALRPLLSPLAVGGIEPGILSRYQGAFDRFATTVLVGGGNQAVEPVSEEARAEAAAAIGPGSPVAAVLVDGDATLAATGTVTYRKGDQILAFGHPFLQQGPIEIPMATAEIVATVADQTYPYKMSNKGVLVGTITQDRLTAIGGQVGEVAPMLPVRVTIRQEGAPSSEFSYRVAQYWGLTPTLVQLVFANSLQKQWRYADEATYLMQARLLIENGQEVDIRQAYSVTSVDGGKTLFDMVKDVSDPFVALYENPFEAIRLEGVEILIDSGSQVRLFEIEDLIVDRMRVRPGEALEVKIAVQQYRGVRVEKRLTVPVPAGLAGGKLLLRVADAHTVERGELDGGMPPIKSARDLDQLLSILRRTRDGNRCYVQLVREAAGVAFHDQQMTGLPGSVNSVLRGTAGTEAPRAIEEEVVWEGALAFDGAVVGSRELKLALLPQL